ncbi:glycosyltransferase [Herbaspirillum sp. RTI4]|uniref:glycosyltransferase n=1 Tax=Herbaspirillum sp. RTI4 TaxID=3048640 RepID=UPI002AB3CC49|nr:glycosyltransferase [Herbaspirillum sp. RTI4]MDY7577607.1 glycosyltransferase [Herbaspirillum sp. RTI4]MEA9983278.1 glycosyltransferase [Herbaspirillum sp. RTI4]
MEEQKKNSHSHAETLEFTGERFVPEEQGNIELEHLHRYMQAREIAAGKIVLDIASGEGYGSSILSEVAADVTGVDISGEAVAHASARYQRSNLRFLQGDCAAIPLPDHSVDLIVSFETIEHHEHHQEMMQEFKRILRPDGVVLISNPDRHYYSDVPNYKNPYHVKELYEQEFKALLGSYFTNTRYFGQRLVYGSAIFPEEGQAALSSYESVEGIQHAAGLPRPVYWVALASDVALPMLNAGIFEQDPIKSELLKDWQRVLVETNLNHAKELGETRARIADLEKTYDILVERNAALINSTSWKLTLPLRGLMRLIHAPGSTVRQCVRYGVKVLKALYMKLPIENRTRMAHRQFLQAKLPGLCDVIFPKSESGHASARKVIGTPYAEFDWLNVRLQIPSSDHPVVSVIVPIYGKYNYTLRCLASIVRHVPSVAFEVIVVDDCSPDESLSVLGHVDGIRVVANEVNMGFLRSCNRGAEQARGEYLCFLNNDTEVTPGWLDSLYQTFTKFPGTGLAGSKLVYPDGVLQEAGGIIWKDGSAWNFGRYEDQLAPVYNYAREVDYCSGASILVPTKLFADLQGFDEHYVPAYCEDSDLALKIRDRGYRVIYQPLSVVVHYEGISCGTDTGSGIKAYQVQNMRKQFDRWQERLDTHQENGKDVDRAKDRMAKRRVLILDHCTPAPDQDAGSVIMFNLMLLLREMEFQVTFIPEHNFLYVPGYTEALQENGIEVLYSPYCNSVKDHLQESGARYDLVLMIRPGVVQQHLTLVQRYCPKAKILFHTVDLHYLRMSREAALSGKPELLVAAENMKSIEFGAIRQVDASIVVSDVELEILHAELPDGNVHVLPLIMDIPGTRAGFSARRDIVFVGGYQHSPNIDAVLYFVGEVMPLLRQALPGVRLHVVGSNAPTQITELASEDVLIIGYVDDLQPLLDGIRVAVAPLRYGAGIKGKIGTAMAAGLPIVATTLATEGMRLSADQNILIADTPQEIAGQVEKIYNNEALWSSISLAGIDFAERAWGGEAAWKALAGILAALDLPVVRGDRPLALWNINN